jgi:hypothetical protein
MTEIATPPPVLNHGLELLLAELEGNQLEVALVPSRRPVNVGGCVRVAVSRNARWYRDFCARHPSSRRRLNAAPDTRIKRANVRRLLEALIAGRPVRSRYRAEILRLAVRATSQAA